MAGQSFEKFSRVYVLFSRLTGILPFEGQDYGFIGSRLVLTVNLLSSLIFYSTTIAYDISMLSSGQPLKVEDIYVTLLLTGVLCRYYVLLRGRNEFQNLLETCHKMWDWCDEEGRKTVASYDHKIRMIYLLYNSSSILSVVSLAIGSYNARLPPLDASNGTERRVLAYNWMEADEPYKHLGYHATFFVQIFTVLNVIAYGACCDAVATVFIMLAVGFFRQLSDRLHDDSEMAYEEVIRCFKFHQQLLHYCHRLDDFVQSILLTQILLPFLSISLVLIKLVSTVPDRLSNVPMMIVCICQLFMIQWTADQLTDQSEGVAFEVYSVLMKRLEDKRLCRNLQIMLTRAQVPIEIMAGGFIELSLENFASMMKGAFSFFTVLRNLGV